MTEYVWDHRNRLVAVTDRLSEDGPIIQSVEYVYDSQNRWIGKAVDADGDGPGEASETHFVYQGNQIVLQIDGEGEVTNRYLWGPAVDQILADEQVQADGSSEVLWPLTDHLNTVRDLGVYNAETDVTTVVNHIVYDAFGRVTGRTDASVTTLFGFTARPFDSATGLQNNLNRWYDAETGTWISVDPMRFAAANANLYRYVGNEVTQFSDPSGLEPPAIQAAPTPLSWTWWKQMLWTGFVSLDHDLGGPVFRSLEEDFEEHRKETVEAMWEATPAPVQFGISVMDEVGWVGCGIPMGGGGMVNFRMGGFTVLGSKQLSGGVYRTTIMLLGTAEKNATLAGGLSALEQEAVAAGATKLRITGLGVRKGFNSPRLASQFGYRVEITGTTATWVKDL